ncbi:hypothetical protein GNI_041710 [Gregarina niphandrodes]|uniref:Uncharacterized protein n=1 Tax=Gregarina niphandrodes TaxID=110365 RepID=A0A023BA97_GRENI|nr:hypothetical protein GNI_041710 [Gregarina niphandrodes]EZG77693.1 hypothetical protein GNI_041710 [Gregarina niphandrodes]|eukprot:XP_011129492.1 hypothetical protein GNI_041710 [Gregarina niphandrodes]
MIVYAIDPDKKSPTRLTELVAEATAVQLATGSELNNQIQLPRLLHFCAQHLHRPQFIPSWKRPCMTLSEAVQSYHKLIITMAGSFAHRVKIYEESITQEQQHQLAGEVTFGDHYNDVPYHLLRIDEEKLNREKFNREKFWERFFRKEDRSLWVGSIYWIAGFNPCKKRPSPQMMRCKHTRARALSQIFPTSFMSQKTFKLELTWFRNSTSDSPISG